MLVTRPDPDASDTAARLGALGIEGVGCPLLVHETLDIGLPDPDGFAAVAATSANGLRALAERGGLRRYLHLPLYAVGDRTAAVGRELGFEEVHSAQGTFADLVELLAHANLAGPIFYPAARDMSADLGKSLLPLGRMVVTAEVYAMNPVATLPQWVVEQLGGEISAVLFYSKRTAQTFVRLTERVFDRDARAGLAVLCLSEAVAEPLLDAHFVRVCLADQPSEEAMMGLALQFARDQNP